MVLLDVLRLLHVIGACVLIGTGAGIAFFMVMAHRSGEPNFVYKTASVVVIADTIFTATAAIAQPITGWLLMRELGWGLSDGWLAISLFLYVFIGVFWLPVVVIQIRMRDDARNSFETSAPLSGRYFRLYRIWFLCGLPAFSAIVVLLWLMINRPDIPVPFL